MKTYKFSIMFLLLKLSCTVFALEHCSDEMTKKYFNYNKIIKMYIGKELKNSHVFIKVDKDFCFIKVNEFFDLLKSVRPYSYLKFGSLEYDFFLTKFW